MHRNAELDAIAPYQAWLNRVNRVRCAFNTGLIDQQSLSNFQRFIFEFGQFNASYTLEELERLRYPKSPFNIMHRHSYLRGTETCATEVLRKLYSAAHQTDQHDYPVFLDSALFWDEIPRYASILQGDDVLSGLANQAMQRIMENPNTADVWVCLSAANNKQKVASAIRQLSVKHIIQKFVPADLHDAFMRSEHKYTDNEELSLNRFLKDELAFCRKEMESKKARSIAEQKRNIKWYGRVFGLFRKSDSSFLDKNHIKDIHGLKKFAEDYPEAFEEGCASLNIDQATPNRQIPRALLCSQAIQRWISQRSAGCLGNLFYFTKSTTPFLGLDVMVLIGHKEARTSDTWGPKSLINRLGYRVEIGRAIKAVLEQFPLLFIDENQTNAFWRLLIETPMVVGLPSLEKEIIRDLPRHVYTAAELHENDDIKNEYERFLGCDCEAIYQFYKQFMQDYLHDFMRFNKPGSATFQVLKAELCGAMRDFISAYRSDQYGDLPRAIRAVQTVGEVLAVELAFHPHEKSFQLLKVIKEDILKSYPVQHVLMAPYGMRAYSRVFQAANAGNENAARPKVSVTNQNYFEWLMSLNGLSARNVDVTHVRQLEDIDRSVDFIFAEIHPNNVTEKKQFLQNMDVLINRMLVEHWDEKQRTLVFDATLNAFDDHEVRDVLDKAKPLVACGALNIILMQSLTKFSQIGLDQRSGGLMVIINNGKDWKSLNESYDLIAQTEQVDEATIQYFSYFFKAGTWREPKVSLANSYIAMVNHKVNNLYHMVLEKLANYDCQYQTAFKLTTSSDPKSCYLSFNTSSILSFIDADLRYTTHDIEKLNEDIVQHLLLPLCRRSGLPLTSRMSIAFPLSSVNIALDSIRFTVGLEGDMSLIRYASIIAYIAMQINSTIILPDLFAQDENGIYFKRLAIFEKAVNTFATTKPPGYSVLAGLFDNCIYGPFTSMRGPAYFFYQHDGLAAMIGNKIYPSKKIVIMQDQIITPCIKMSAERFDEFMRGSAYEVVLNATEFSERYPKIKVGTSTQFMPLSCDRTNIMFTKEGFGIERDYLCVKRHGMTVFKRAYSEDTTAIELDYWQEKDSAIARYINFVIALYMKKKHGAEFKVRSYQEATSSMYTHFLFHLKFDDADRLFRDALDVVHRNRPALVALLHEYQNKPVPESVKPYRFYTTREPGKGFHTYLYKGPSSFAHPSLVGEIQTILGIRNLSIPKNTFFKKGFLLANNYNDEAGSTHTKKL